MDRQAEQVDSSVLTIAKMANAAFPDKLPTIRAKKGFRLFPVQVNGAVRYDNRNATFISSRIAGRIEQLYVRYNYEAIKKGQLLLEIYSPELVTAQRELLRLHPEKDAALYQATLRKLRYLGMDHTTLAQLLKDRQVLYRIPIYSSTNGFLAEQQGGDNATDSPLLLREGQYVSKGEQLFTIYADQDVVAAFSFQPTIAPLIQAGKKKILFHAIDQPDKAYQGRVDLIEPSFASGEAFTVGRVYLPTKGLRVGQLLQGTVALGSDRGWWLPQSAVIFSGTPQQAFIYRKTTDRFIPVTVQTGLQAEGWIQILTDISDWDIAEQAEFLQDSEGFINTPKP